MINPLHFLRTARRPLLAVILTSSFPFSLSLPLSRRIRQPRNFLCARARPARIFQSEPSPARAHPTIHERVQERGGGASAGINKARRVSARSFHAESN